MKKIVVVFFFVMILVIMYFIFYMRNIESYDQEVLKLKIVDYIIYKNNFLKEVKFDLSDVKKYEKLIRLYIIVYDKNCVLIILDNFIGFGDFFLRIFDRKELEFFFVDVIICFYYCYVIII